MRNISTLVLCTAVITFAVLSGCGKSEEERAAQERTLNADTTILTSCAFEAVTPVSLSTMSGQDTAAVCDKMAKAMGENPSVRLLRQLSMAVYHLKRVGRTDDTAGEAYQFMRIAEARGQLKDSEAMIATFNVVYKIITGTDGRVTAKDLNIFLREVGPGAMTMSDEGLINSASVISAMKQDQGG